MLIRKSAPQPRSRKTPTGGRMMARMILQMSLHETRMSITVQSEELLTCPDPRRPVVRLLALEGSES